MNILEKILEEIESLHSKILKDNFAERVTEQEIDALIKVKEIIRSHISDVSDTSERQFFTDKEYRILLKALSREREVCEKVDKDCGGEHNLIRIMNSIERKIKDIQYGK